MNKATPVGGQGQSLIELLIAMGVFILVISVIAFLVIDAYVADRLGKELTQATFLAEQGLEVARSIRNNDWSSLSVGDHGIATLGGSWTFSGTSDTVDKFTRVVTVETIDSTRKKVTSQITWDLTDLRPQDVSLVEYLTDWGETISTNCDAYCQSVGYTNGTCRGSVSSCGAIGGTAESGGDTYCTGGPSADTCCCGGTPPPADTIAPADISDIALLGETSSSIDLDWTAPGDDGSTGTATSYDVRYSTSLITLANWGSATQATGEPTPSTAGSSESMTVSGLSANTLYYFAIKTSDEVPNESGLSNVPSLSTLSAITTCDAYCIANAYSSGTCRKNSGTCNANGETYELGGDTYCIGGPLVDTCCCAP